MNKPSKSKAETALDYILSMKATRIPLAFHVAAGQLWSQFQKASGEWFRAKVNLQVAISHPDYSHAPSNWNNRALLLNLSAFGMTQLAIYNHRQHKNSAHFLP